MWSRAAAERALLSCLRSGRSGGTSNGTRSADRTAGSGARLTTSGSRRPGDLANGRTPPAHDHVLRHRGFDRPRPADGSRGLARSARGLPDPVGDLVYITFKPRRSFVEESAPLKALYADRRFELSDAGERRRRTRNAQVGKRSQPISCLTANDGPAYRGLLEVDRRWLEECS